MSGFIKRNKAMVEGVSPSYNPNVGQYGWASMDRQAADQMAVYVNESKELLDTMDEKIIYVEQLIKDFNAQGPVRSINGKSGVVVLSAKDIGAMPFNTNPSTVSVGNDSAFSTINDAIAFLIATKPVVSSNGFCEINLKSGFIMGEQVLLFGGQDLSWIKITSQDPVVTIDHTKITTPLSIEDGLTPVFGAANSSKLPVIGCKFTYQNNTTSKEGVAVVQNSEVQFMPGSGVVKARNGLKVLYGSKAVCYIPGLVVGGAGSGAGTTRGVDFSYAANRGLHVAHGSSAFLARSDFSHSGGDYGVYCIWNSRADLYQSDASHANGTAFNCRDGSVMNCRESCASDSKRGYHALHGALLNCRSKATGSEEWVKDSAKRCSEYGILVSGSSRVEAAEVDVSDCTGSAGCSVGDASSVSFQLGTALNCKERGVWATGGSSVQADGVDVSNSKIGLIADNGSTISAPSVSRTSKANDCTTFAILATNGSNITFGQGEAKNANRALEAREGSTISARDAILTGAKSRAVSAIAGSEICVIGADVSGSLDRAITARDGSKVSANSAKITPGGTAVISDAEVKDGGFIFLNASTGFTKFSPTDAVNTFNEAGTVYKDTAFSYELVVEDGHQFHTVTISGASASKMRMSYRDGTLRTPAETIDYLGLKFVKMLVNASPAGTGDFCSTINNGEFIPGDPNNTYFISSCFWKADGTLEVVPHKDTLVEQVVKNYYHNHDAIQAMHFRYVLVKDGAVYDLVANGYTTQTGWEGQPSGRTSIGQKQNGDLVFAVIDGNTTAGTGVSVKRMSEYMLGQGCVNAMNLDGSGSSTMYYDNIRKNSPSDGKERAMVNVIYFQ